MAGTLLERPVLCDLLGAQAAVLERNVPAQVVVRFKRSMLAHLAAAAGLLQDVVPELDRERALRFAGAAGLVAGAIWAHGQPSAGELAFAGPTAAHRRLSWAI